MSSGARRGNYAREVTPSGVIIEYNLDNPDSPPHFSWPNFHTDLDDENVYDEEVYDGDAYEEEAYDGDFYEEEAYDGNVYQAGSTENNQAGLYGTGAGVEVPEDAVIPSTDLYYRPGNGEVPIPAVYHHDIREELMWAANLRGRYSFKQPRGENFNDETSFLAEQQEWGTERANYPWIVFEYHQLDRRDPEYQVEHWYHQGKIVLDCEGVPMRRFTNIPDVLSSEYPGVFMEANRRQDSRIKDRDFGGRMPPIIAGTNRDGQPILKFPKSANTLSSRRRRFRQRAGCITWGHKPCPGMLRFLEERLPQDLKDRNTTYGFRDLTNEEISIVQSYGAAQGS